MNMVEALTGFRDWLKEDSKDRPKGLSLIHDILKPAGRGIYDLANMSGQAAQGQYIEPTAITKPLMDAGIGQGALAMTKGALMREAYDPNMVNAFVWQGGPHKYGPEGAAKSLEHIGKGEGAQAYGWGRYDAGAREVADQYRKNLAYDPAEMQIAGRQINDIYNDIDSRAARMSPDAASIEYEKMEILERLMNHDPLDEIATYAQGNLSPQTADWFSKDVAPNYKSFGHLYKHDLPDEDIARYLDWDKPLSESEMIRVYEALDAENPNFARAFQDNWYSTNEAGREAWSGQDLYYELSKQYGSDKAASEALARAGIPGLKYLDGMSRGAGEGSHNYVTWDQDVLNRMKLLERNGVDMTKALMGNK